MVDINQNVKNRLTESGFSEKEAAIYIAVLELGEATASDIAKKAELKRTTTYNILPELATRGLVKSTMKRGVKHYFVEDVKTIQKNKEAEVDAITDLLPELSALHSIIPQKPRITVYEGLNGLKTVYEDALSSVNKGSIILSYAGTKNFLQYVPNSVFKYYVGKRLENKIRVRIITSRSTLADELKRTEKENLREVKLIDDDRFDSNSEMLIYNNKVAFISYKENFMSIIIESPGIFKTQELIYERIWNTI